MAVICGPITKTISGISQVICGHIVKIYDIKTQYSTIDIIIDDQQIIPGVGSVSVALAPDFTTKADISLISKNVPAGTADIIFTVESITVPPPPTGATHYLDLYLKPYSWYTPGGAADHIATKLGDINGAILNLFSSVGISDYQYIGTQVLTEADKPNLVTIRIQLKQIQSMYGVESMAVPLLVYIAAIVAAVFVIIIIIGVITGWKFTLAGAIAQITGKDLTKSEVVSIIWDKVVTAQLADCEKNFTDPVQQTACKKAVTDGAADGGTDALGLSGTDSKTLGIDNKIDACTAQYNIDKDATKYKACVDAIAKAAGTETKNKTPTGGADIVGTLIFGVFILGGLYIVTRG